MSTGIIASRYAKALHRYVTAHGDADRVCRQAMTLEMALLEVPELRQVLMDPAGVSTPRKMEFLQAALGVTYPAVAVPTLISPISSAEIPAISSACSAAAAPSVSISSPGPAIWRAPIPVRVRIHSSLVSTVFASSSFVTERSGSAEPVPAI